MCEQIKTKRIGSIALMTSARTLFEKTIAQITLDESRQEKESYAFWLLEHFLHLSRTAVLADRPTEAEPAKLIDALRRLNANEPIQYIVGEAWFYGRPFHVNPEVLIPRPETELLVDEVLKRTGLLNRPDIADIGTGSGCLAVTLALEIPGAILKATDIHPGSLVVAEGNQWRHKVKIDFLLHNILHEPLPWRNLDVMVSNPPYVRENEKDSLGANVKDYEPRRALFVPDNDPLIFHKALARAAKSSLKPGGSLITEINEALGRETADLFTHHGFHAVTIIKDLSGKDRAVSGTL